MKRVMIVLISLMLLSPVVAQAGCELDYQACDKSCTVKYLTDDGGKAGCVSKCVAKKGVCLAKDGAEKTAEAGGKAWDSTKSFFKALTEE